MSKKRSAKSNGGGPKLASARKTGGGLSRSSNFPQGKSTATQPGSNSHFSLQDEARNTERSSNFWTIDTRLRTRAVKFVSAGLHTTMDEEKPTNTDIVNHEPQAADVEGTGTVERTSFSGIKSSPTESVIEDATPLVPQRHVQNETNVTRDNGQLLNSLQANRDELFVIDTAGDPQVSIPNRRAVPVRSPSPASSDSSDEVVFHGRASRPTVVDDPVNLQTSTVTKVSSGVQTVTTKPEWDDTTVEWDSRSKPGVGWSVPKAPQRFVEERSLLTFRVKKEDKPESSVETDAADDYLENIKSHLPETLQATVFEQRELDFNLEQATVHEHLESLSLNKGEGVDSDESTIPDDNLIDFPFEFANDTEDEEDDLSSADGDLDLDGGDDEIDDEKLAALLAKQEELGMGSDELGLFDGDVEANVAKAARRYAKEKPKNARRPKGSYPSASLLADVLEQDPYGGFDIMDFDRPSLRKRKGKGKPADVETPFDFSDSETFTSAQSFWENDREKKKAHKQEREELRAQGLLGKKNANDVTSKYGEGMTIWDIGKEFETFLGSSEQQQALPPMDKRRRKMVHEIATEFNLKTKSIGQGTSRHTILIRTSRTTRYFEHKFVARARRLNMGFFPRMDAQAGQKSTLEQKARRAARHAGGSGAVRYQDGDVVGGTAPEIGTENRGRAMLERMGWSAGMGLGAGDNKGILQPIAHIVKNTKSGLG